eukprot:3574822-Rhodomonas_salina.1
MPLHPGPGSSTKLSLPSTLWLRGGPLAYVLGGPLSSPRLHTVCTPFAHRLHTTAPVMTPRTSSTWSGGRQCRSSRRTELLLLRAP